MILLLFRNSNLLFKISIFVNDEGLNKIIIYNYKDIIDNNDVLQCFFFSLEYNDEIYQYYSP